MAVVSTHHVPVHQQALSVDAIEAASIRIADAVARTPLEICPRLSADTGAEIFLKREDLQAVRSYKLRGAYNVMAQLSAEELSRGVVAASAGNHAQGVAFACRSMQVPGRIYVPTTTPKQKRDRIRWHGGDFVDLRAVGDTYDAAAAAAQDDVMRTGSAWIHAFDDPRTAAGQGTIAHEIVEQLGRVPDVVVAPVGGGGCLAGMATYFRGLSEDVTIVGVEPTGAVSLSAALVNGGPVTLAEIDPFVDGAAVKRIGTIGHRVLSEMGATVTDHPVLASITDAPSARVVPDERHAPVPGTAHITHVDEGAICSAMLGLYQNEGIIAEPAGALAVAILDKLQLPADSTVVCLVSGGNNDVSRYGEIIERSLVHRGLKHYFLVDFPQEPGALRRFLDEVLGPDDDITLFEYVKRNNRETGAALVGVELGHRDGLGDLMDRMAHSRLHCERLEPGSPAYAYLT
ncbi:MULTISPECIES: threonine ammonia-lyase IlvA [unclassified Gordonia (in: high G+C Gram-positive bacteria)]|uniref:threonine ammonia-lyase IlvA n=1 Tax=unclassified Gordonia (in: high G+C Gram-positive bacteria) TaxID=2657482 RepID=UPI000990AFBB|nr:MULTISPECIES: threonine ammonia-lyase IlvA [unclassified Gordonia (in: high G+C Gram-positive bacteria)]MBR7192749.1 threonine ammonia-lyase IlvA [Gordonia sp. SCSIO 19800]MCX2753518.1 threonine ammonia-lyase IlvA [Gordonia sp. 4N]